MIAFCTADMSGCKKNSDNDSDFAGTGTVRYIYIEGGFYGIEDDSGQNYDPIDLPDEFKIDGLRVRYNYVPRFDMTSVHMWGTMIQVIDMQLDAGAI